MEILKIIDIFLEDSQIISGIFRVMRKAILIVTNEEYQKGRTNDTDLKKYNRESKVIPLIPNTLSFISLFYLPIYSI